LKTDKHTMTPATCYNPQQSDTMPKTRKPPTKNAAAQALGRLGGRAGTKAQNAARAQNAQRAGAPRRVCTVCLEPVKGGGVHKDKALDATCAGRDWVWQKPSERAR
jgi:hypothetical protein